MDKLRDPKQTVGDVLNFIAEENPHLPKDEDIKPFFNDKKALKTRIDTIMFIMYKSLNMSVSVNKENKEENNNKYLMCRHPRTEDQSNPTFIDDLNKAGNINERVKEMHIEKTTPMPNVFDAIRNCLKDNKSPKIQGFIQFIDSEFLSLKPNARSTQEETKNMSVKNIIKEAIENSEKKQVIFTGAPGTGKTYGVEEYVKRAAEQKESNPPRWEFVQFHSSFDYTDFVEGLRPVQIDDKMVFVRMDGIFKAFCRKVAKADNKNETYYFIIDEINRADLGRVFGELMYCFEKRGKAHSVKTQYNNLPTYDLEKKGYIEKKEDVFEEGFYIPENVVILGTMNDIDRSVETFDFALRRRFDWVEIKADDVMEDVLDAMGCNTDIVANIKKMNEVIAKQEYGLGKAFAIGPAYFKGYKGNTPEERKNSLETIWKRNIEPILLEYMRGRRDSESFLNACKKELFGTQNSETEADSGEQL